ncbi:uncharacterized protein LOC114333957 [Diabrotica virgifera virgifera]|uniref:Uncharacterized protein LOC114333957 n=1 Tax=Diabrotica virgifera virgifera TaxID=50390 RepID=A0A6P7FTW7_DIAVI|nr:uncharacterized protein LOC114333957 [Diabrotica virgifera virgifera]
MMFIIPDKVLETLICTYCHKYLSVKPTTVYPNRDVECGRCAHSALNDKQKYGRAGAGVESLYGKIAEKCLFKCINRFDGCRELLRYSQVLDHEKVCLENIHMCPICYVEMRSFLMLQHFHSNHKDAILGGPSFVFNLNSEGPNTYIYQEEDNLFCLYISYSKSENTIKLELVYMGSDKVASNIYHQFTVTNENKEFDINCNIKPSCANEFSLVDASNMSHLITVKFKLIYQNVQLVAVPENIHLSSIKNSLGDSSSSSTNSSLEEPKPKQAVTRFIYKSPLYYTTEVVKFHKEYNPQCINCEESCTFSLSDSYAPEYYYCPIYNHFLCFCCFQWLTHKNEIRESNLHFKQTIPSTFLTRFCKWKCGVDLKFSEIVSHEIFCKKRTQYYKCPYKNCGIEISSALALTDHLKIHTSIKVYPSHFKLLKPPFACYVLLEDQLIGISLKTSGKYDRQFKLEQYTTESKRIAHALFFYDNKFTPLANLPISGSPEKCTVKIVLVENE